MLLVDLPFETTHFIWKDNIIQQSNEKCQWSLTQGEVVYLFISTTEYEENLGSLGKSGLQRVIQARSATQQLWNLQGLKS